jgi:hypothetical protein
MQRSGHHPGQQQQQQGPSEVEPLHEQLLLAVGVPPEELKLAAGLTAKHADRYSTKNAPGILRALTNALSADVDSIAAATEAAAATARAGAQVESGSSSSYDQQHATVAAVGGCDRLLAPTVVGALLELLLLTCAPPLGGRRSGSRRDAI